MLTSMTAFGRGIVKGNRAEVTVEIKSVNSRYFDCNIKLPRICSGFEERIKSFIQAAGASRGKVDVYLTAEFSDSGEAVLDPDRAAAYIASLRRLRDEFGLPDDITTVRVAQNRDIFRTPAADEPGEEVWELIRAALEIAAGQFFAAREAEGGAIGRDIRAKLAAAEGMIPAIESETDKINAGYAARLRTKLNQLLADHGITADEGRIITECAIFADRTAIDEELVRLRCHLASFREIMDAPAPAGRKLDFMLQEINREINTIGSKCSGAPAARIVVDLKSEFEKIREQVQNLE